jgi:exosortase/archaeosortase family protein
MADVVKFVVQFVVPASAGIPAEAGTTNFFLAIQIIAFWPVWRWYAARMTDGSDEPWGWAALAVALIFVFRERPARRVLPPLPAIITLCYAVSFHFLSPLPRAILAVAAISSTISALRFGRRMHFGILGLLLLSLPLVASLQFYLAYPLRAFVAMLVAPLLRMQGLAVVREGIALNWAGKLVAFDAPCSGVKMLWAGLFLAFTLACFFRLNARRTAALIAFSIVAVVAGNVLRSTALFYVEADVVRHLPPFAHEGIGVAAFAMTAAVIAAMARHVAETSARRPQPITQVADAPRTASLALAVCFGLAAVAPLLPLKHEAKAEAAEFPGWPTHFEGHELKPLPLSEREQRFAAGFPGRIARFTASSPNGQREIILRWVVRETRALHSASDCFKGLGYAIHPLPMRVDESGNRWSSFEATRDSEGLRVLERIYAGDESWTDVSTWYWQALLGKTRGPWWAVTVTERGEPQS